MSLSVHRISRHIRCTVFLTMMAKNSFEFQPHVKIVKLAVVCYSVRKLKCKGKRMPLINHHTYFCVSLAMAMKHNT